MQAVTQDLNDVRPDNVVQAVMAEQVMEQVDKIDEVVVEKVAAVEGVAGQVARVEEIAASAAEEDAVHEARATAGAGAARGSRRRPGPQRAKPRRFCPGS